MISYITAYLGRYNLSVSMLSEVYRNVTKPAFQQKLSRPGYYIQACA